MRCLRLLIPFLLVQFVDVSAKINCATVKCSSSVTQASCKRGELLIAAQSQNGCCPGCKGGIAFGSRCSRTNNVCAPGLKCDYFEDRLYCIWNEKTCLYLNYLRADEVDWRPACNLDGTYGLIQCRGDRPSGRCFCYSATGARIFGWSWWRSSQDMTCACSRRRSTMEENGRLDVTLHCQQNGNYEELQCDDGVCWCAEPETGRLQSDTVAVHESLWKLLPCYNATTHGDTYLRQCESAAFAQRKIIAQLGRRGTTLTLSNIQCDYDGTYGKYEIDNGLAYCTWRDGNRIGAYQAESSTLAELTCNCARDQMIYKEEGSSLGLQCGGNGNYVKKPDLNGEQMCVDRDGYVVRDYVTEDEECDRYIYYSAVL